MPFVKNSTYPAQPFIEDLSQSDFFIYYNLQDLITKTDQFNEGTVRCRTVGILQSLNGKYFLTDLDSPSESEGLVQVSVIYLKSPPKSTVMPYPVQIFGTLQWRKRPVIYAKILQVLSPSMALMLRDTMSCVTRDHLAKNDPP